MGKFRHRIEGVGRVTSPQMIAVSNHRRSKEFNMRERTKFSLGMEGEYWVQTIPGLVIPVPGTDLSIIVTRTHNQSFSVFTLNDTKTFDNMVMTAAYVSAMLDSYHAR